MGFEGYNAEQMPQPIRGPFGLAFIGEIGAAQDRELARLRTATLSRLPSKAPADALDAIGRALKLPRYPEEDDTSYRARLVAAWPTWEQAGAATSIEAQIVAAFGCDVRVYPIWELNFGPDPLANYAEFWVVLGPNFGTFTGSAGDVIIAKRIILKWKATHGYPVEIVAIAGSGPLLGWGVVGGAQPLSLGAFSLGGATSDRASLGRTLNGTLPPLGDALFILGGYYL